MPNIETSGQKLVDEIKALIKARNAFIVAVTVEEKRVDNALIEAAAAANCEVRFWDCRTGITDALGKEFAPGKQAADPMAVLDAIRDDKRRAVWVLHDFPVWFSDPNVLRAARNLARSLPSSPQLEARTIILVTPKGDMPPELSDHAVIVKWTLPDRAEIATIFDNVISGLPPDIAANAVEAGGREAAIEAAVGLSANAAQGCYANSLVTQGRKIVPQVIAAAKRRVITGKGLEWHDPDPRGLAAVGGLENFKEWAVEVKACFSEKARAFGLPSPKGCLLVGPPGGGKSLSARALAAAFEIPLIKLDLGGMQSKWVGESQGNIRAALGVVDAIGNCIVYVDEIEKSLAGASQGAADGGVSSDALGTFLTWMQEHTSGAFVMATANDVRALPPELLRKGRFDELWWVDLPTKAEREDILRVTLRQFNRESHPVDVATVAKACEGFVGAEIASLMTAVLKRAFVEGERVVTTADFMKAASNLVPLSKTSADKINELREWAKTRARRASLPEVVTVSGGERNLDL